MRIILFLILVISTLTFSQNFISVYYIKPETQVVNDYDYANSVIQKYNIPLNGFALEWSHHLIKSEWILVKGGCKFSYVTGSFLTYSRTIESRTDIYTGEAEISLALNKFKLKPFFSFAAGYQNYRRDAKVKPDIDFIYLNFALKDECYPYSFSAGVEYRFVDFLSAVIYYNKRFTNYNLDEQSYHYYWGREINNQMGSFAIGITYVF